MLLVMTLMRRTRGDVIADADAGKQRIVPRGWRPCDRAECGEQHRREEHARGDHAHAQGLRTHNRCTTTDIHIHSTYIYEPYPPIHRPTDNIPNHQPLPSEPASHSQYRLLVVRASGERWVVLNLRCRCSGWYSSTIEQHIFVCGLHGVQLYVNVATTTTLNAFACEPHTCSALRVDTYNMHSRRIVYMYLR